MAETTPREWAMAVGGGLLLAGVLVWVLRGAEPDDVGPPVPVTNAPSPAPPVAMPPAAAALPAPATDVRGDGGFKLRGIILRAGMPAAIIELADGRQRLVRQGGLVADGVQVESIAANAVTLRRAGGLERLGFSDAPPEMASAPAVAASDSARLEDIAARPLDYRLGMTARKAGTEIKGYAINDLSGLPLFRKAGLREGDVVVSVNGNALVSSEKVLDLPGEVAGAYEVKIVFERGGVRQTANVAIER